MNWGCPWPLNNSLTLTLTHLSEGRFTLEAIMYFTTKLHSTNTFNNIR